MPAGDAPEHARPLTAREVADLFRVGPKTVARWSQTGKLSYFRTIGGHRRYRVAEVMAKLADAQQNGARPVEEADSAVAGEDGGEGSRSRKPERM